MQSHFSDFAVAAVDDEKALIVTKPILFFRF